MLKNYLWFQCWMFDCMSSECIVHDVIHHANYCQIIATHNIKHVSIMPISCGLAVFKSFIKSWKSPGLEFLGGGQPIICLYIQQYRCLTTQILLLVRSTDSYIKYCPSYNDDIAMMLTNGLFWSHVLLAKSICWLNQSNSYSSANLYPSLLETTLNGTVSILL